MKVTIINGNQGDDQVIYDGEVFQFPLTGLIDDAIWAIQYEDNKGEIEFRNGRNQTITELSQFDHILQVCRDIIDERASKELANSKDVGWQRQQKIKEISNMRDSLLSSPTATISFEGVDWQVDATSSRAIMDAITLYSNIGGTPIGFEWRDAHNVNHPATVDLLKGIASKRAEEVQAIWKQSWVLKDAAASSSTLSQIVAIVWPTP